MSLPVTNEYLAKALVDGAQAGNSTLTHCSIGQVQLLSGRLVACDPMAISESVPFDLPLPTGTFPVTLSVAKINTDQRVAFGMIRFRETSPVAWDMLTLDGQDCSQLKEDELFGYPVDSGTGCFMDHKTGKALLKIMENDSNFFEVICEELQKNYVHTWGWTDHKLTEGNLIAFYSGYGDGVYASYAGFDADGEVSVIVTDFQVASLN